MTAIDTERGTDVEGLRGLVRGRIVDRTDEEYDDARQVYNGAVDRHPVAVVRVADVADVIACVNFARDHQIPLAVRGGGHHGAGFGVWDDALVIDFAELRSTTVDPRGRHGPSRCRVHLGRCRPRDRRLRTGHPVRVRVFDRCRGPDPRGRQRLPVQALRPHRGQPALGRPRAGGRELRHRQRGQPPGPVLGAARWGWQLRRRHVVHVPLPRRRRGRHRHRRPGALRHRRHRGGVPVVPGPGPEPAGRAQRLDRCAGDPVGGAVPRGAVGPQGLRDRVVLLRRARRAPTRCWRPCGSSAHRCWWASSRCRSPSSRAPSTGCCRPACSGTGRPTSSRRSRTTPSPCTAGTARASRRRCRPCTSTRSAAPRPGCPRTPRPSRSVAVGGTA